MEVCPQARKCAHRRTSTKVRTASTCKVPPGGECTDGSACQHPAAEQEAPGHLQGQLSSHTTGRKWAEVGEWAASVMAGVHSQGGTWHPSCRNGATRSGALKSGLYIPNFPTDRIPVQVVQSSSVHM